MFRNKRVFVAFTISILLIKWTKCNNPENPKLKDALQNSTNTKRNQYYNGSNNGQNAYNEDDNILRSEAKKMLKQCGVDSSESQNIESFGNSNGKIKTNFNNHGGNNLNNRRNKNNDRNSDRRQYAEYGDSNNDGDWNAGSSQNWYKNNIQSKQGNRNYNANNRGQSYNSNKFRYQSNEQSYEGSPNQYRSGARSGQYDQDQDNNQNDKYPLYGSSSIRNVNSEHDYGGYNSNNQNEYGSENSNNNRNGYDNQNPNNRYGYGSENSNQQNGPDNMYNHSGYDSQNLNNPYSQSGQNFGYGSYGHTSYQGGFDDNRRTQTEYGAENSPQNKDRGYQSSYSNNKNCVSPYYGYDRNSDQKAGFDENGGITLGYMNGGTFGLTPGQHIMPRSKRGNYFNKEKDGPDDDNQCISQCAFGYLQLLDNDRTPSETMVIKWLQEHVKGSDMERIKALRDARRCFARLTTADTEDGCDFSKELASCLDLQLE